MSRASLAQTVACGGLVLGTLSASAQDLKPLDEVLAQPDDRIVVSYVYVRCAAMYEAVADRMGDARMGKDQAQAVNAAIRDLVKAALAHQKTAPTLAQAAPILKREKDQIIAVYKARMDANYASTGQAFAEDATMKGDMKTCNAVTTLARNELKRLGLP